MKPAFLTMIAILLTASLSRGDEIAQAQAERLFALKVRPLLKEKCFACHGDDPKKIKGELNMLSLAGMLKGGELGEPAIVPGKPDKSLIFVAMTWKDEDLEMPPKENDRLTAAQIEQVRRWIAAGAPWPDEAKIKQLLQSQWKQEENKDGTLVKTSGGMSDDWTYRRYKPQDLWAYEPIRRYDVPWKEIKTSGGKKKHAIDAFVQQQLSAKKITPAEPADKLTLIRRATFDLTGLPPPKSEIDVFLNDDSPNAFDKVLTRLLGSPRYGERMAQHWLDVARYADTSGYANDYERPHAWRYRDYVVRSFNKDKPFDRFIIEQIAGDELDASDPEKLIAVGFLRMGPWEHTGMSVQTVTRQLFLDDVTNTIGESFLAINMSCFKCHDHKFDPLPTRDYYRMQAIFAPAQFGDRPVPFQAHENTNGFKEGQQRAKRLLQEVLASTRAINKKKADAIAALLKKHGVTDKKDIPGVTEGNLKFYGLTDLDKSLLKINGKRKQAYERQVARFNPYVFSVYNGPFAGYTKWQKQPTFMMPVIAKRKGKTQDVHILEGGALESPAEKVSPGVISAFAGSSDKHEPTAFNTIPNATHGRRLAVAKWVASENNTMTARVIVNRVWQWHFGTGIVNTPNAFGRMGGKPTHPELLDYLATWFMDHEWSFKRLHRFIMTSAAYQRSGLAAAPESLAKVDPQNKLLSFFPPRRQTAEELRDGMLAITGEMNWEMGGPGVYPEINWEVALQPRQVMGSLAPTYQPSRTPQQRNRRTVYAFRYRGFSDPIMEVFNRPGTEFSCAKRDETTVTPQVFALFNSQFVHDRTIALADRLVKSHKTETDRVVAAFEAINGRKPSAEEQQFALAHVRDMLEHHRGHKPVKIDPPQSVMRGMVEELTGKPYSFEDKLTLMKNYVQDRKAWQVNAETRALAELCLVLLNSNEFVYVY